MGRLGPSDLYLGSHGMAGLARHGATHGFKGKQVQKLKPDKSGGFLGGLFATQEGGEGEEQLGSALRITWLFICEFVPFIVYRIYRFCLAK